MAKAAVNALKEKKGQEICVMETTKLTSLADYFVLCTATSTTQMKTLSNKKVMMVFPPERKVK